MGEDLKIPFNFTAGDQSGIDAAKAAKNALADTGDEAKEAARQWDKMEREIKDAESAVDKYAKRTRGAVNVASASADDLVGKADTASAALGTLSSTIGVAGSEALMASSDVLAVVDSVGMLRKEIAGAGGLRAVVGDLVGQLGTSGLLTVGMGAAAVGAVALTKALSNVDEEAAKWETTLERVNREFAEGVSGAGIQSGIAKIREEVDTEILSIGLSLEKLGVPIERVREIMDLLGEQGAFLTLATDANSEYADIVEEVYSHIDSGNDKHVAWLNTIIESEQNITDLTDDMDIFNSELLKTEAVVNDTAVAAKNLTEWAMGFPDAVKDFQDRAAEVTRDAQIEAAEEAAEATRKKLKESYEYGQQQLADIADATRDYNDEIAEIEEGKLKALADLEQRYSDALVSIAEQAADEAEAAYKALQDEIASANQDIQRETAEASREAGREDLQARLDFQRDEAKAARDHARDMQRIREDAEAAEIEMGAKRDYSALYYSRLSTSRSLERAAGDFGYESRERRIAFEQERADTLRQRDAERQERLIDYSQRIADARAAYQAERTEINQQRNEALLEAKQAYDREAALTKSAAEQTLRLRAAGYQEEIRMLAMTSQQRLQIEAQTQQALLIQAQRTTQFMNQMLGSLSFGSGGGTTNNNSVGVTQNINVEAGLQNVGRVLASLAAGEVRKQLSGVIG